MIGYFLTYPDFVCISCARKKLHAEIEASARFVLIRMHHVESANEWKIGEEKKLGKKRLKTMNFL